MRLFALLFAALVILAIAGCTDDPVVTQPIATGTISGAFTVDPDMQGTSAFARVDLYESCDDMICMRPLRSVTADKNGNYTFTDVRSGTYHVGAWKDNDGNGIVTSGDLLNDRSFPEGCKCCVQAGNNVTMCGILTVVP